MVHIITDLDTGGAEMMLYKLLSEQCANREIESFVVSLMGHGPITERIENIGVEVYSLNLGQGERPSLGVLLQLIRYVRMIKPQVIQGWMYHGNIAATVAAFFLSLSFRKVAFFWNVRQTLYDLSSEKGLTRSLIILSRWFSWWPSRIVYNSSLSAQQHEQIGFSSRRRQLIPNGFDLNRFRPKLVMRKQIRESLNLPEDILLVGHISRFHPMKDHATLLKAGALLADSSERIGLPVVFLLVGRGVTNEEGNLSELIASLGVTEKVLLLGERSDIPDIMRALDVAVSPSAWGEGFPNAVGEAMASEVPCVVTDVGDSAAIVGDSGLVVDAKNPSALASALLELLSNQERRVSMGVRARERIQQHYSISAISGHYLEMYEGVLS